MSHGLSKSRLQAFRQCPKRLWLAVHRPDLQEVSEETERRFQIGFQVGDVARALYPDGILIDTPDASEALALTQRALADHPDRPADCAIQAWVIGAALPLTGAELAHVDTAFVYPVGGDYHGLLKSNPLDGDVAGLLPAVPQWVADARATLARAEPTLVPGPQCHSPYDCPFEHYCGADQPPQSDYPLGCLPRLSGQRLQGLVDREHE